MLNNRVQTSIVWMLVLLVPVVIGGVLIQRSTTTEKTRADTGENTSSRPPEGSAAKRIVSLAPSITEVLVLLERTDRLVGVTKHADYLDAVSDVPEAGGFTGTNYERIIAQRPDLVLLKSTRSGEQEAALERVGIETMTIRHETIEDILRSIRRIGNVVDRAGRARTYVRKIRRRMEMIRKKTKSTARPSVLPVYYREYGTGQLTEVGVAGSESFLGEIVELAGGRNGYTGSMAYPKFSVEFVIRTNPAYIVDFVPASARRNHARSQLLADWRSLSGVRAVRRGQVHVISEPYALLPGPRFLLLLEGVTRLLHPSIDLPERDWVLFGGRENG